MVVTWEESVPQKGSPLRVWNPAELVLLDHEAVNISGFIS